jgi:hypothetical protein
MFELIFLIITGLSFSAFILYFIKFKYADKKVHELERINNLKTVDFKYATEAMVFIDSLVELKFSYHLYSVLMPIYLDKKIPEKKQVNEIKENI